MRWFRSSSLRDDTTQAYQLGSPWAKRNRPSLAQCWRVQRKRGVWQRYMWFVDRLLVNTLLLLCALALIMAGWSGSQLLTDALAPAQMTVEVLPPPALPILPTRQGSVPVVVVILPPTPTVTPTPTPTPMEPDAWLIGNVPAGIQERNLNCEFQSSSDLVAYYGRLLEWQEIFIAVGHDPNGDPNVGFAGSSFDDAPGQLYPSGYGVYAPALAHGLQKLGIPAHAHSQEGVVWLRQRLAANQPVMIWTSYAMRPQRVESWTTRDGTKRVNAIREEHTYVAIGYTPTDVVLNDPYDGRPHHFAWQDFARSWDYLDQMALTIDGP